MRTILSELRLKYPLGCITGAENRLCNRHQFRLQCPESVGIVPRLGFRKLHHTSLTCDSINCTSVHTSPCDAPECSLQSAQVSEAVGTI